MNNNTFLITKHQLISILSALSSIIKTLKSCQWWIFPASHFYKNCDRPCRPCCMYFDIMYATLKRPTSNLPVDWDQYWHERALGKTRVTSIFWVISKMANEAGDLESKNGTLGNPLISEGLNEVFMNQGLWVPGYLQCKPYRMPRWTNVQIF